MKIREYKIVQDEDTLHPQLFENKELEWNGKLESIQEMTEMMVRCFHLNALNEEYVYVLGFDNNMNFKGVFELSHGTRSSSLFSPKCLGTFLLLVGADKFMLMHNHPSGVLSCSKDDFNVNSLVASLSITLDMEFIEHAILIIDDYMLTKDLSLEECE